MKSELNIYHNKYQELSTKALDWFIKSLDYMPETEEWQICRLKEKIYEREAQEYLKKFEKGIKHG